MFFFPSVKFYLLNLLRNAEVADVITPHVTRLSKLLSEPARWFIKPIETDYNFIEVKNQYFFDIAKKRFSKENESLKGFRWAFIAINTMNLNKQIQYHL